jgi:cephalosporin hydroxylase
VIGVASLRRRRRLRRLDTIADVRRRSGEFEALRQAVRRMGTDDLEYFDNGYTHEGGLALQQHPDEFAALCIALRERGPYGTYLEIGTASGGQCLALYREVGFERAVIVDDGKHPRAGEQASNLAQLPDVRRWLGDSHSREAAAFVAGEVSGGLDLALIDGDHTYEGVRQDIELLRPFARAGTLLVLHDTAATSGAERAWRELVAAPWAEAIGEYVGRRRPLGIGLCRAVT